MVSCPLAFALFAGCACPGSAVAQMSDDIVKLGVLIDMTSLSDATGSGSLIAAQMAAEDYGGKEGWSRSR